MKNCVLLVGEPYILFISVFWISGLETFIEQVWAMIKQGDYPCDLCLPCHLFPGAISQCKVWKELRGFQWAAQNYGYVARLGLETWQTEYGGEKDTACQKTGQELLRVMKCLLCASHCAEHFIYTVSLIPQLYREVGSIIIPILQVRKLRHREFK